jgi:predicted nucleic acid-binding protein
MLVIKDSMVLIHLSKMSLLKTTCGFFGQVMKPPAVFKETVVTGRKKEYPDAIIIDELIKQKLIIIKKIKDSEKLRSIQKYGLGLGEAEAVVLYHQENADYLFTDDDVCREYRGILNINILGTPAIILLLFKNKKIDKTKAMESINILSQIGWFENELIFELKNRINSK